MVIPPDEKMEVSSKQRSKEHIKIETNSQLIDVAYISLIP